MRVAVLEVRACLVHVHTAAVIHMGSCVASPRTPAPTCVLPPTPLPCTAPHLAATTLLLPSPAPPFPWLPPPQGHTDIIYSMALAGDCVVTGGGGDDPTGESDKGLTLGHSCFPGCGKCGTDVLIVLHPRSSSVGPDCGQEVQSHNGGERQGAPGECRQQNEGMGPFPFQGLALMIAPCMLCAGPHWGHLWASCSRPRMT